MVPQDIHENQTICALKKLVYPVGYNHIQNYVCLASMLLLKTTTVNSSTVGLKDTTSS